MKKKQMLHEMEMLQELVRKIQNVLSPHTHQQDSEYFSDATKSVEFYNKYPSCFVKMGVGRKHFLFPICNRMGFEDPKMIKLSLRLADRMYNLKDVDGDSLNIVITKLNEYDRKFSKDIPKPISLAVLKSPRSTAALKSFLIIESSGVSGKLAPM